MYNRSDRNTYANTQMSDYAIDLLRLSRIRVRGHSNLFSAPWSNRVTLFPKSNSLKAMIAGKRISRF